MRFRWLTTPACLLGTLLLGADPLAAQPGGFNRGDFGKGGDNRSTTTPPPAAPIQWQPAPGSPTPPPAASPQPPSGRGGPSGGMRGGPDPERMFGFFARGGEVIDMNTMTPEMKAAVRGSFERRGMPPPAENAVITKSQFVQAFSQSQAANGGAPGGPPMSGPPGGGWNGPPGGGWASARRDDRDSRDKEREKAKDAPVAVRYGKLPPNLPDWFAELDTDRDGQVGLYEWRAAGKDPAEFEEMDLDGDGLIAPQELIRYTARKAERERLAALEDGGERPSPSTQSRDRESGNSGRGSWGNGGNGSWGSSGGKGGSKGGEGRSRGNRGGR